MSSSQHGLIQFNERLFSHRNQVALLTDVLRKLGFTTKIFSYVGTLKRWR
jgi:hypothetical protein